MVSAGEFHSCGIRTDSTVVCWGERYGQTEVTISPIKHLCRLGSGGTAECEAESFRLSRPGGQFESVSTNADGTESCGKQPSGNTICWSFDDAIYSTEIVETPGGEFTAVSAGGSHACGIRPGGTLECWGEDLAGQLDAPTGEFTAVSAGDRHSCGLRTDGATTCWGNDTHGESTPPRGSFAAVSAGRDIACGLRSGGSFECWGDDYYGQGTPPN